MTDVIETYSEEETYKLGFNIGKKAEPGLIITLIGKLSDQIFLEYRIKGIKFSE